MDGVTPVKVSSVRWRESNSGQPGQLVPSVLSTTAEVLTLWPFQAFQLVSGLQTYAYSSGLPRSLLVLIQN